jgi:hypothetical protein
VDQVDVWAKGTGIGLTFGLNYLVHKGSIPQLSSQKSYKRRNR